MAGAFVGRVVNVNAINEVIEMKFKQYRRTQIAEMADWEPDFDMNNVSISRPDQEAGSPKIGDKIARNPANHEDMWLVSKDYFDANFEPLE